MSLTAKDGFPYYFGLGNTSSLRELFSEQSTFIFLESITNQKAGYRYAADK